MAPKRWEGKEVATSTTEGPSPPPVIERPIAGRDLSLLFRDFHLFFKANSWLFHDESRTIHCDPVISGSSNPLISLDFLIGNLRTEGVSSRSFYAKLTVRRFTSCRMIGCEANPQSVAEKDLNALKIIFRQQYLSDEVSPWSFVAFCCPRSNF